jgi:hypothetical protein
MDDTDQVALKVAEHNEAGKSGGRRKALSRRDMVIVAQYEVLGKSEKTRSVPERTVEKFAYLHQGCDKIGRSIGPSAIGYRLFPPAPRCSAT